MYAAWTTTRRSTDRDAIPASLRPQPTMLGIFIPRSPQRVGPQLPESWEEYRLTQLLRARHAVSLCEPREMGTRTCKRTLCAKSAAPNRTAEIANRDTRGNQGESPLQPAVSGSESKDLDRHTPRNRGLFRRDRQLLARVRYTQSLGGGPGEMRTLDLVSRIRGESRGCDQRGSVAPMSRVERCPGASAVQSNPIVPDGPC